MTLNPNCVIISDMNFRMRRKIPIEKSMLPSVPCPVYGKQVLFQEYWNSILIFNFKQSLTI